MATDSPVPGLPRSVVLRDLILVLLPARRPSRGRDMTGRRPAKCRQYPGSATDVQLVGDPRCYSRE
jgi:hypothetical protein